MSERTSIKKTINYNIYISILHWFQRHPQRFRQGIIVVGVLLLSAVLVYVLPPKYLVYPIILITALGGFILYLRFPPIGLFAIITAGLLVQYEIGTNTNSRLNFVIILLPMLFIIWIGDMVVRQRRIYFVPSRPMLPLLALAIISLLAFGVGRLPWFLYAKGAPLISQLAGLAIFLLSVVAFILVANLIPNIIWLKRMTWFFLAIAGLYMLASSIPAFGKFIFEYLPSGSRGSLLYVWLIAIVFSQVFVNRKLNKYLRIALISLLVITFYVAFFKQFGWKSGWIPPLVVIGVIIFLRYPRLGILLAFLSIIFLRDIPAQIISTDEYSYTTRMLAWEIIWDEIIKVNPFLGLGPANYYFYTPLYPILGYSVQFNSHNNYVDIVAQVGLLGLASFAWFTVEMGLLGFGLLKKRMDNFAHAYVVGVLGGLVGTLVAGMLGDWVIPFVYNIGLRGFRISVIGWMFMGGLVVIEKIYSDQRQTVEEIS